MNDSNIHISPPDLIVKAGAAALGMLAIFLLVLTLSGLKEYHYIGSGTTATNTISVTGEGEVFAVPDLASFSVTIQEEAKEVKDAQKVATQKTNDIIAYLKSAGIADKDIKTTDYSVYPKYNWQQEYCAPGRPCTPGKQIMEGFTVSQTISVKVRDTDKAGDILSEVGKKGANTVSGLDFTIDDEDKLKSEARAKAITDAETKGKELADQLGVDLVRIVGFSENGGGYYPQAYAKREVMTMAMDAAGSAPAPELPKGENKIQSNVNVTYEIR